jgi:hypothetical protein
MKKTLSGVVITSGEKRLRERLLAMVQHKNTFSEISENESNGGGGGGADLEPVNV